MKVDKTALRSKVARRIFAIFVLCTLLPILCVAIVSFRSVTKELAEQSRRRLHQASKSAGMAVVERLYFFDHELERLATIAGSKGGGDLRLGAETLDRLRERFMGIVLVDPDGDIEPVLGQVERLPDWTPHERQHLASDKVLLSVRHPSDSETRLYLSRAVTPPDGGILVGELRAAYLWRPDTLPPRMELTVIDQEGHTLFSTMPIVGVELSNWEHSRSSQFEWGDGNDEYIAASWSLPLKYSFLVPRWTVILSESKTDVLAPITSFKTVFPLLFLTVILLVLLLSISQIRRILIPLEKLKAGTERTANREFSSRVEVKSRDEFEELANSFNNMTLQLGRQFHALESMAEIDRAVLSTTSTEKIVETVLDRVPDIVPCDWLNVVLFDFETGRARLHVGGDSGGNGAPTTFEIESELVQFLDLHRNGLSLESDRLPVFLEPLLRRETPRLFFIPVFLKERLMAALALGYQRDHPLDADDLVRVRQMVGRIAVALKNARDLWGSIVALARTIDAKSPWTAGHSERAAEVAAEIGRELDLGADELEDLHRGALLHDIGKIAIDSSILNKQGQLTVEEREIIKDHPRRGARILEEHDSFANSIPVVAQHHECWDGSGYPYGLVGEEINLLARIYAVADVYDALVMDRPYRSGMKRKEVLEFIRQRAGSNFEPRVVDAFLRVMEQRKDEPRKKSIYASSLLTT